MWTADRSWLWRYGAAPVATGLSMLVRVLCWPVLVNANPFLTFFPVIVVCVLYGGFGPGLLATACCTVAAFFLLDPPWTIYIAHTADVICIAVFPLIGVGVCWIAHLRDRAVAGMRAAWEAERQACAAAEALAERVSQSVRREQQHARQLQALADASLKIHTALSLARPLPETIRVVPELAREVIGAHAAAMSMTVEGDWSRALFAASLSDKYAAWRTFAEAPEGKGLYALVCRTNRPMRLTQAELEKHPAWGGFGKAAGRHPPLRGWLAVPLIGRDGQNLGVLQLSDRFEGEFTADDEAIALQLAMIASVALENVALYNRLQDEDRRKDVFLATLAHELRNPLAPVLNVVQLMKHGLDEYTLQWSRDVLDRQVQQMKRLVDELSDMSRIARGKVRLRKERVDVAAVVARAVEACRPLLDQRRHELTVALPQEPVVLEADPTRLAQILCNLLNNAAKYSDEGAHIWLTVERAGGGGQPPDEVVLRVRDTGMGIPAEMLPHIFDLFVQVDRSLGRAQGGLGIGLALVRSLVEMHGGRITARSDGPGKGSEFIVRLPVSVEAPAEQSATGPAVSPEPQASRRVLVVDDNRDGAETLATLLRATGHEVRVAYDGPTALAEAHTFRPDVVLCDIGMPGMDGYEVARRLRQDADLPHPVLIAVTGYGQAEDRRRTHAAGFDHHLTKPVDLAALQQVFAGPARAPAAHG